MADKNNAVCAICGKGYHLCMSCKDKMALSPWKMHTDTSEHYKIYQIVRGFNIGVYSKEEAKAKLKLVDLSDLNDFREHIRNRINDIMKDDIVDEKLCVINEISQVKQTRKKKQSVKNSGTE